MIEQIPEIVLQRHVRLAAPRNTLDREVTRRIEIIPIGGLAHRIVGQIVLTERVHDRAVVMLPASLELRFSGHIITIL